MRKSRCQAPCPRCARAAHEPAATTSAAQEQRVTGQEGRRLEWQTRAVPRTPRRWPPCRPARPRGNPHRHNPACGRWSVPFRRQPARPSQRRAGSQPTAPASATTEGSSVRTRRCALASSHLNILRIWFSLVHSLLYPFVLDGAAASQTPASGHATASAVSGVVPLQRAQKYVC